MKEPDAVRERLAVAWRRNWTSWLGGGGSWPLTVSLDPPIEAEARRHWPHFQAWLSKWNCPEWEGMVTFGSRAWSSLGPQDVPTHVILQTPEMVASALGAKERAHWETADTRWKECLVAWPECESALRRTADWLGSADEQDYQRFVSVVEWLTEHPNSSLWLRQIPVAGLDTKWVEVNIGRLRQVLACRLGREATGSFAALAGLATDEPRRRMRLLDPVLRESVGGLGDLTLSIAAISELDLPVRVVLVVENQQSALAFGDIPGAVVFVGGGFAVAELRGIHWLARAPVLYWGDIDNAGFSILHLLRSAVPEARSVLMDEETLLRHQDLWSHDDSKPGATLARLTEPEQAVYAKLGEGAFGPSVRLEQERIEWAWADERVRTAVREACGTET